MKKHFVITLGCEYGSGGPDIGRMIAEELGIKFYDRALIDKVVEALGVGSDLVEKADNGEQVHYEFDTKLGPRYANLTNRVIHTQFEVIRKLADKSSCLFVGRCSDYVLRGREDCVNVFVYAPEEYRVRHIMAHKHLSEKKALEEVRYYDEMLHARYKYLTGTYRGDRHMRHLLVDSSVLGLEKTAKFIMQFIDLRFENL